MNRNGYEVAGALIANVAMVEGYTKSVAIRIEAPSFKRRVPGVRTPLNPQNPDQVHPTYHPTPVTWVQPATVKSVIKQR